MLASLGGGFKTGTGTTSQWEPGVLYDSDVAATNAAGDWSLQSAQEAAEASKYGADRSLEGVKYASDLDYGLGTSELAQEGKQFDQQYGSLSSILAGYGSGDSSLVGGTNTAQQAIDTSPIWSDQQINERVNSSRAQNDASAQGQAQQAARQMSGQGFSSQSPILAALQGQPCLERSGRE